MVIGARVRHFSIGLPISSHLESLEFDDSNHFPRAQKLASRLTAPAPAAQPIRFVSRFQIKTSFAAFAPAPKRDSSF